MNKGNTKCGTSWNTLNQGMNFTLGDAVEIGTVSLPGKGIEIDPASSNGFFTVHADWK